MPKVLLINLCLILQIGCASRAVNSGSVAATRTPTPPPSVPVETAAEEPESVKRPEVPSAFRDVDFENRKYPVGRGTVRLSGGTFELSEGSSGRVSYRFEEVDYADVNNDGRKEAIVHLSQLICGGSCDGGTDLFYFYTARRGAVSLLTKLEIGSFAYDCGLKLFKLRNESLVVETFRTCRFTGSAFRTTRAPNEEGGKLGTNRYTQFKLKFTGGRFIQRKREVFSYPEVYDFRGHERTVDIN